MLHSNSINIFVVSITFLLLLDCIVKDDDACLQNGVKGKGGPWRYKNRYVHTNYPEITCESKKEWCKTENSQWNHPSHLKDMHRCCPVTCQTGTLTEIECHALEDNNRGRCIYPNEAQCYKKGTEKIMF